MRLVTAGHGGDVTVWDAITATPIHSFSVGRSRRPGPLPRGLEPPEVWAVVVALSPDGSRAAAVTIEGTVYVWDVGTGAELLVDAHAEAVGDLSRKTSRLAASCAKAYHAVAITDDGAGFAAITSATESGRLIYDVEI